MTLDNILEEIKKANTIAIVVHENPDGDAIGSALAMKLALEQLNKEADVIIPEYPSAFSFLPGVEKIKKEKKVFLGTEQKMLCPFFKYNNFAQKGASLMGESNIYLHGNIKCTKACKTCLYL